MDVVGNRKFIAWGRDLVRAIPLAWRLYETYWRVRFWVESRRSYEGSQSILIFGDDPEPSLKDPVCQLCTANQFDDLSYRHWCKEMDSPARFSRKQWEFVYIAEVLDRSGMLQPGRIGLGFGCGAEPLPGLFAGYGCEIVATDLDASEAKRKGWVKTGQHASDEYALYRASNGRISRTEFMRLVSYRNLDMNHIPDDIGEFDFVWSACALEHLGSLRQGMEFIKRSARCLKPGGVAVHTTEFNLSSDDVTFESAGCSIYRKKDILRLADELRPEGYEMAPLNLNTGNAGLDRHVDAPPYGFSPHLKLMLEKYIVTSIGIIIRNRAE